MDDLPLDSELLDLTRDGTLTNEDIVMITQKLQTLHYLPSSKHIKWLDKLCQEGTKQREKLLEWLTSNKYDKRYKDAKKSKQSWTDEEFNRNIFLITQWHHFWLVKLNAFEFESRSLSIMRHLVR